jgi:hypothetical protein
VTTIATGIRNRDIQSSLRMMALRLSPPLDDPARCDPICRRSEIVGYQQRAVPELGDIDRAVGVFGVLGQPPLGKRFGFVRGAIFLFR